MMFNKILKISRPRFWLYIAGPYLVGLSILYRQRAFSLQWEHFLVFLFLLFPMNFLLYSINDFFDQDTDADNPKKNMMENRLNRRDNKIVIIIQLLSFLYALAVLIFLLPSFREKTIFVLFLALSFFYSTPPFAFKRRPFLDALSNSLYFLPGVLAIYHHSLLSVHVLIIIALICWTAAMHLFSAIPDIVYDQKADITTTAVFLGRTQSLILCAFLWFIFAVIAVFYNWNLFPAFIYPLIPMILLLKKNLSINKTYWYFPYMNGILGFLFFLLNIFSI